MGDQQAGMEAGAQGTAASASLRSGQLGQGPRLSLVQPGDSVPDCVGMWRCISFSGLAGVVVGYGLNPASAYDQWLTRLELAVCWKAAHDANRLASAAH